MYVFHSCASKVQHVRCKRPQPEKFTSKDLVKKVLDMFVSKGLPRLDNLV